EAKTNKKRYFLALPHPDSSLVGSFYALICKNACRINSGVRRTRPSLWTPSLFGGGGSARADPGVLSRCANRVERGPGPACQRVCPRVLPQIPHPSEQ